MAMTEHLSFTCTYTHVYDILVTMYMYMHIPFSIQYTMHMMINVIAGVSYVFLNECLQKVPNTEIDVPSG